MEEHGITEQHPMKAIHDYVEKDFQVYQHKLKQGKTTIY